MALLILLLCYFAYVFGPDMILISFRDIHIYINFCFKYVLVRFLGCYTNLDEVGRNESLSDRHEIVRVIHCPTDADVLLNNTARLTLLYFIIAEQSLG